MNNKDQVSRSSLTTPLENSEMNFHHKLREATKNHHAQIENAPLFKKIGDATITLDEYLQLLKKLYGYIAPCEHLIHGLLSQAVFANREKTLRLENDLMALGVQQQLLEKIPRCKDLPLLQEQEQVLGYLYVIEGSTLGGQVITKILQAKLNLTPAHGLQYFYGYGKDTKATWQYFCQYLNQITSHEQQNKIIHAVSQTYHTLYDWVSDGQSF